MSTYINPINPRQHSDYSDCPELVVEYLRYSETIRGLSPRTVNGYYIDLRTFFKFLCVHRGLAPSDQIIENVNIAQLDLDFIKSITKAEIYEFLYYATRERENSASTRARKLSSIKGFFKYLTSKTSQIANNPAEDIERPVQKKRLPKYLSMEESMGLLNSIQSDFYERDYCMITFFLNCGMRVSELVLINVGDIKNDSLRIIGKGNKERIVYLNEACLSAVEAYNMERAKVLKSKTEPALFISRRTGNRLSVRRVQQIVNACLQAAGLESKGYSVHKLRHTAATLMYRHGHVDLLSLKELLGHTNVSTTQIYTHLETAQLREAAAASPLANIKPEKPAQKMKSDENAYETPLQEHSDAVVENPVETVDNLENQGKKGL